MDYFWNSGSNPKSSLPNSISSWCSRLTWIYIYVCVCVCVYILNMWNSSFLNLSSCLVNTRLELEYSKLDFLVGKFFTHLELEISKLKFLGSKFFFFFFFQMELELAKLEFQLISPTTPIVSVFTTHKYIRLNTHITTFLALSHAQTLFFYFKPSNFHWSLYKIKSFILLQFVGKYLNLFSKFFFFVRPS